MEHLIRKMGYITEIFGYITGIKTSHHDLNIVGYRRATYIWTKRDKNAKIR